jgi:transposase-like protein
MSALPRIARVPHTSKAPESCPYCGGRNLTRRGTRKKKLEIVQLWRCSSCKRVFTPGPAALRNQTYPLRTILTALTDYNLGYSVEMTAARLQKKTGRHLSSSTITSWLREYRQHCTYRRLRADALKRFPPEQTIRSIQLYHRQVYGYAYHRPKLDFARTGRLDDRRTGDTRFAALADFLEALPITCPHDVFRRDDDPKARASQATPDWADVSRVIVNSKRKAATETAALIIPSVGNNKLRHETLQRFMLINDSVTVAIEVPIWLTEDDIASLEHEHNIELAALGVTGHIDFLQVRNGVVHILDYKPDARTNKPIAQLAIYALALTRRVPGLRLFDIKCAWFNEDEYCEFFPRTLFVR